MDQIDPRYLKTILDILNGSEKPLKSFEYSALKIKFHSDAPDESEAAVTGFKATGPTRPPQDNSPEGMYKRLTGTSVPEFMPKPPEKSEG